MVRPHFYTTQLQAGAGLVEETRLLLSLHEPGMEPQALLAKALESGLFSRVTARRLRNVVIECFAPRYLREPDAAHLLKRLAEHVSRSELLQLLLLYTARANLILRDFLTHLYWPRYASGRDGLTSEDTKEFVLAGIRAGQTRKPWSDSTIRRMCNYLLSCCADYELLTKNIRGPRKIQALRVQDRVAAYLAYDLKFQGLADNQIVAHEDWLLLGLQPNDVRDVFKRLSLQGYAVEGRRRVKEQMNKRKTDDEYARINLSYISASGQEVVVFCPESRNATATLEPSRRSIHGGAPVQPLVPAEAQPAATSHAAPEAAIASVDPQVGLPITSTPPSISAPAEAALEEQHFTIHYGDTGHSYESMVLPYLNNARTVTIEDPYIRATHQVQNFVRFCEAVLKVPSVRNIVLITSYDETTNLQELSSRLDELKQSLLELDVALEVKVNENLHDREIRIDNGWIIKIGRGLDFFQKPDSWFGVGANDISLRRCLETKVDIFRCAVK